jgi:hypothetical protein
MIEERMRGGKTFDYMYCRECGGICGDKKFGHYPFHCCNMIDPSIPVLRPFCKKCGKTQRLGFVASATCQCGSEMESAEEETHVDRHGA